MNQLPDAAAFCACYREGEEIKERLLIIVQIWFMVSEGDREGGSRRCECVWARRISLSVCVWGNVKGEKEQKDLVDVLCE